MLEVSALYQGYDASLAWPFFGGTSMGLWNVCLKLRGLWQTTVVVGVVGVGTRLLFFYDSDHYGTVLNMVGLI
jgi:hypothetical protein